MNDQTTVQGPLSRHARAYVECALETVDQLLEREGDHVATAAAWMAEAVSSGGLIHAFGTGHSRLLVEDIFYRAGGLAPIDAILEDSVSGYHDVTKSEHVERLEGFGALIVTHRRLTPPDVLLVFSQSGRNAVPIEVALTARNRGLRVVGITSVQHASGQKSRHSSGKHLNDVVDLVIDTGTPLGDCAVTLENGIPMGPLSTVVGSAVAQVLVIETAHRLQSQGIEAPVFRSGNMDGGREWNDELLARYWGRIPGW
jgi:uncharacterized phosphosugar-binding protein